LRRLSLLDDDVLLLGRLQIAGGLRLPPQSLDGVHRFFLLREDGIAELLHPLELAVQHLEDCATSGSGYRAIGATICSSSSGLKGAAAGLGCWARGNGGAASKIARVTGRDLARTFRIPRHTIVVFIGVLAGTV